MNNLRLLNTMGREKQEFSPIEEGKVRFYHCGPTVYWVQHIGNMRAMTMADLVHRTLLYIGHDVTLVRNYTDVGHLTGDGDEGEDKMTKGAQREKITPQEIAEKYIKIFENDIALLNTIPATHTTRATEYIQPMIEAVQVLIEKGYAYVTPKAVYFDVSKAKNYTQLSGQKLELQEHGLGKGSVSDPSKRNPADFSVWFFKTGVHKNALQYWSSPFESPGVTDGEGFPGWHLECVVMSSSLLGDKIDIHMGGVEHIPIHHTNEIAQAEAITGKKFSNFWLHNEHLLVDGGKMSKSAGTSYTVDDVIAKGFDPLDLRYFFLTAHYRSKQNFTWQALEGARVARLKLVRKMRDFADVGDGRLSEEWKTKFVRKLMDDVNVPNALAVVWDMLKSDLSKEDKRSTLLGFDRVLGLNLNKVGGVEIDEGLEVRVEALIAERTEAKLEKNYIRADEIRAELEKMNVVLEDTKDGVKWQLR